MRNKSILTICVFILYNLVFIQIKAQNIKLADGCYENDQSVGKVNPNFKFIKPYYFAKDKIYRQTKLFPDTTEIVKQNKPELYLNQDVFITKRTDVFENTIFFLPKKDIFILAASYIRFKKNMNKWHFGWGVGVGGLSIIEINHFDYPSSQIFELAHAETMLQYRPIKFFSLEFGAKVAIMSYAGSDDEATSIAPGFYLAPETGFNKLRIGTRISASLLIAKDFPFIAHITPYYIRYYISR